MRMVPKFGALAQLGERLICIQEVRSSILLGSTKRLAQQGACPKPGKLATPRAQPRWVGSSGG